MQTPLIAPGSQLYLKKNYHSHTPRCHHAHGSEREFVEKALATGFQVLGFSDHTPNFFEGDYYSTFRMRPEELEDYVRVLSDLREEYKSQIEIKIGLECEYYPKHFQQLISFISGYPIDYIFLGQHFINNEYDGYATAAGPYADEQGLQRYAEQVVEGLSSGKYSFCAHPDIFNFDGDDEIYAEALRPICEYAKAQDIPLEMNFLGVMEKRNYPKEAFWKMAGEIGNTVIYNCDAHFPEMLDMPDVYARCEEISKKFGLLRTDEIVSHL